MARDVGWRINQPLVSICASRARRKRPARWILRMDQSRHSRHIAGLGAGKFCAAMPKILREGQSGGGKAQSVFAMDWKVARGRVLIKPHACGTGAYDKGRGGVGLWPRSSGC